MEKLSLREIAAQLGCPQPPEGEITRVITDSREAGPGTLFVALATTTSTGRWRQGPKRRWPSMTATTPQQRRYCG